MKNLLKITETALQCLIVGSICFKVTFWLYFFLSHCFGMRFSRIEFLVWLLLNFFSKIIIYEIREFSNLSLNFLRISFRKYF